MATGEGLDWVMFCVDKFWEKLSLDNFRLIQLLSRTIVVFLWNIKYNEVVEYGGCWSRICSGSVLCRQRRELTFTNFRIVRIIPLDSMLLLFIWCILQRTTYWNLVPTGEVFALAVCYVDNFWETQLLWPIFEQLVQALWTERYETFCGTFQRTTYWNLAPSVKLFACAVFNVNNFGKHNFFGRFSKILC